MNRLGRDAQDVTYQISNLYAFQFQRRRILKMGFLVPMFQLVTPGARPVLTPGTSYEETWYRSTRRSNIPNIKALSLSVSEKKNFEVTLLYSYAPNCDLWGGASFDPKGHHMNKLGRGPQGDAIYQVSKL